MKDVILTISLIIVFLVAGVIFLAIVKNNPTVTLKAEREVKIGETVFKTEVVDNPALWTKGLSGRASLPEDGGMLFIFPDQQIRNFWMKDMKFPIDIIWIRDNKIIGIVMGAEPAFQESYEIYTSPEPADTVLEINAGLSQKLGIQVGDTVN
ncbi:MAG: DUF192 domain-containing protein [Patescibacteria group bacterium]